jgi:asparagine synthase (glutamine-hydrolysing)
MCGIVGIAGGELDAPVHAAEIHEMCAAIVYRGPDDQGIFTDGAVGLGMRRLSIIDVAGGHQPVHNEDRSVWVVCNGEIYNFLDLREELEARGHTFYTHSDTEVLVHAYESYGPKFICELRGMFAFALYDIQNQTLVLGRDRLGKKPLHYALHKDRFYFGSEIKSLIVASPQLADVSQEALGQFFYYGYIPDPKTVFTAIRKLPPGYYLEFKRNVVQLHKYWDLPQFASSTLPESDCLEQLEGKLRESVRIRLISEVPLGALLSGGVDSSVVVGMMASTSDRPVKTFSIGFSNVDFNEANYARVIAKHFGTDHHELIVQADLWGTLEELSRIIDEPFADSSIIPTYHVARMARKHVTVVLSGDGGDELFAGYDHYIVNYRRRYLDRIPRWVAPSYHRYLYPMLPSKLRSRKLIFSFVLGSRERYINGSALLPWYDPELTLLTPEFIKLIAGYPPPEDIMRSYYDDAPAADVISRMQYTDIKTYLTADVLTKVDRMSMACSLEVRCPLLDQEFVEMAVKLPLTMKIRNGTRKYLLRCLAEKMGVPQSVLYRPKQGFALPLKHWMRAELRDDMTALLLEPRTLQRGYFRKGAIERMFGEHHRNERDHSVTLWQLLAFELWNRNYLEQRTITKLPAVAC